MKYIYEICMFLFMDDNIILIMNSLYAPVNEES